MSYKIFLSFSAILGTRETEKATIDDFPFRLQYKVATVVSFLACALLSATELIGMNFYHISLKQKKILQCKTNIS